MFCCEFMLFYTDAICSAMYETQHRNEYKVQIICNEEYLKIILLAQYLNAGKINASENYFLLYNKRVLHFINANHVFYNSYSTIHISTVV